MTPTDIIARLQGHDRDHAEHKAAVHGWLVEAGFHPDVTPCRVALYVDSIGVWCGHSMRHGSRAIDLMCLAGGKCVASVVSYGGHTTYHACTDDSPVEALRALAKSGKVPGALLRETT